MVYAGFGHGSESVNGSTIYNDFYRFDTQTDTWERMNDFPAEARVAGTQFSLNGKGYVLSGEGKDHYYLEEGEFWEYEPTNDTWTQLPSMPGSGRWAPGSFVIGNTVYATSGTALVDTTGTSENQSDLWAYKFQGFSGTTDLPDSLHLVEVYPNPVQDLVLVQGDWDGKTRYQVLGSDGRVLRSGLYAPDEGIEVGGLIAGVYGLLLERGEVWYWGWFVRI